MDIKITPSVMCCELGTFAEYIKKFEELGVDSLHFDVMDGHFVKNCMLSTRDYKGLKQLTNLPIDLHMMTDIPEDFIEYYDVQPGDRVCFHPEITHQSYKILQTIHEKGCKAGLVLNPGTPLSYLEECIHQVDYVTIMTVNPGFSGQKMVPDAPIKIRRTRELLDKYGKDIDIIVDGNTTLENSLLMKEAGANVFVGGTSNIFKGLDKLEENFHVYFDQIK